MPGGRPSKYKKEFCKKLVEHMSKGLSFETFGASIGVSHDTIFRWVKKYPEFSEAKTKGLEQCRLFWEELGVDGASGKCKGFNTAAWIFNMKNRFQWRDRTPDEVKEDRRPIVIVKPSTGERETYTDNKSITDGNTIDVEKKH